MGRAAALLSVLLVVAPACGGTTSSSHAVSPDEWRANARQVVEQLRVDIATASVGGTTRAAARAALRNTSDLYALLVAYSDLGGCRAMVGASSAPPRVAAAFEPACRHLERASSLFARAAQRSEPGSLVRAARELALAQPGIVRAALVVSRG